MKLPHFLAAAVVIAGVGFSGSAKADLIGTLVTGSATTASSGPMNYFDPNQGFVPRPAEVPGGVENDAGTTVGMITSRIELGFDDINSLVTWDFDRNIWKFIEISQNMEFPFIYIFADPAFSGGKIT